jgi:hypothetical protein
MRSSQVKRLLVVVKGLWGERFLVDPDVIGAWALVLEGQDPEACAQAALVHMKRAPQFPPSPGEILHLVKATDVDRLPTAEEAWEDALGAVAACEDGERPRCSFPLTQRTLGLFGFEELRDRTRTGFVRAQFIRMYDNLRMRAGEHAFAEEVRELQAGRTSKTQRLGAGLRKLLGGGK